jgi:hypothetical protein
MVSRIHIFVGLQRPRAYRRRNWVQHEDWDPRCNAGYKRAVDDLAGVEGQELVSGAVTKRFQQTDKISTASVESAGN